ncbi:PID-CTERM protein-sorting domain-containing protein [Mesoflavibacter sp. SCSIO 43206]|uniref:PID-CTERM protein-sorting domain-containing protein n=1 Tax=Mesoflavibacter sp. SCSIO 43206 TaxID=2779362 RepID=UPI0021043FC3|nr:hypothetical protein [Mesoflavibacter sp. SCSIO 43206]
MFFNLINIVDGGNVPPPPPPPVPPPGLPIDSGIVFLIVAALIYGVYKVIKHKQSLSA